jgi:hypothetical protein
MIGFPSWIRTNNLAVACTNPTPDTNFIFKNPQKTFAKSPSVKQSVKQSMSLLPNLLPLWINHLKAKYYSPKTIKGYQEDTWRYLQLDPNPTRLSIESYIAKILDKVSAA